MAYISIVIPSYNQAEYIEETINSVLNQDYKDFELIIIDGGSTDKTLEIIKKYEKHLSYWESEPDRGQSHAINKGFKHCSGQVFNWINSDDYYNPDALKIIAHSFQANQDAMVVAGKERAFFSETGKTSLIHQGTNVKDKIEELIYEGIIDQPATFWRMDVVRSLGPLPESLHYTMDSAWWTKFLLLYGKEKVLKIPDILTNFRLHQNSKSVSRQNDFLPERMAIRKEIADTLDFNERIKEHLQKQSDISLGRFFESCKNIDPEKRKNLEISFAQHIYPRYYMEHNYKSTRALFRIACKRPAINMTLFLDFIKILIMPPTITKFFRRLLFFRRSYSKA